MRRLFYWHVHGNSLYSLEINETLLTLCGKTMWYIWIAMYRTCLIYAPLINTSCAAAAAVYRWVTLSSCAMVEIVLPARLHATCNTGTRTTCNTGTTCNSKWTSGRQSNATRAATLFVWKPLADNTVALAYATWKIGEPSFYGKKEICLNIVRSAPDLCICTERWLSAACRYVPCVKTTLIHFWRWKLSCEGESIKLSAVFILHKKSEWMTAVSKSDVQIQLPTMNDTRTQWLNLNLSQTVCCSYDCRSLRIITIE